jgi:hypothetical protein
VRYRVSGSHEVLEHKPGEEFEADLDPVTEARLYVGGHIERLDEYEFDPGTGVRDDDCTLDSDVTSTESCITVVMDRDDITRSDKKGFSR